MHTHPTAGDIDPLLPPVQLHDWDLAAAAHAAGVAFERAELMMRCNKGGRKRRKQQELRQQQVRVCVCVCVHVHAFMPACVHGLVCIRTSACVCMRARVCVYVYVCFHCSLSVGAQPLAGTKQDMV